MRADEARRRDVDEKTARHGRAHPDEQDGRENRAGGAGLFRSRPPDTKTSVRGEAVEQAGAARRNEVRLAASPAGVRRVPRAVVATLLVRVAELHVPPAV